MNTATRVWFTGLLLTCLLPVGAPSVFAKGKAAEKVEEAPSIDEDTIAGEAFIATKVQFVKFTIDGKEWENHEYVDGAKTLVIRGLDRHDEHTVVLTPRDASLDAHSLTIKPSDFKKTLVKQKGRTKTLAFRANYKVDFAKAAPADKAPEADKSGAGKK
jgi:hypothetical protein